LNRFFERKSALALLLVVALFLLAGDGYELGVKEMPQSPDPPTVTIKAPSAPVIENPPSPTPEPEKRCWLSNHFGFPNSTVQGAVTATAVILHCNHKIEAPFVVEVEFDRDFILGTTTLLDSGVVSGAGEAKRGRVYSSQINSPALLSDQIVVVTVYGRTDQYPRAVRGDIKALH
ncbi:MAG: hypothetical protein WCD40_07040, partial [Candidatus Acidiferrales bacterium]